MILSSAPPILQTMLLRLQKYNIELSYKDITLADTLSRVHVNETGEEIPKVEIIAEGHIVFDNSCLTDETLSKILCQIVDFVLQGWPANGLFLIRKEVVGNTKKTFLSLMGFCTREKESLFRV